MRLLVTRPRPAAERTAEKLQALGHQVTILPLMEAQHLPGAVRAALDRSPDGIAVTSAEAVRVLAALGPAVKSHLAAPLFAVGKATALAASGIGFTNIRVGGGTGEALAETVAAERRAGAGKLLYLAGAPRADGFERALSERGIDHVTVECYRMAPVSYGRQALFDLVRPGAFDGVLLYSRETARHLAALLKESNLDVTAFSTRYLCMSSAVREALPDDAVVQIAAEPDENALLKLL